MKQLDSMVVDIDYYSNQFKVIDSSKMFYIYTDTITDSTGIKWIGRSIIDPFFDYNGNRLGKWRSYYPNGQLRSEGEYTLAAFTICQAAGPSIISYYYKKGLWKYYHSNGKAMAAGHFTKASNVMDANCGDDAIYFEALNSTWKYWNTDGEEIELFPDLEREITLH